MDTIYLYFDSSTNRLYLFTDPANLSVENTEDYCDCYWDKIESVTHHYDEGLVKALNSASGRAVEFPISKTVLMCQKPNKK